jgi:hypothetical protein
MFVIGLEYLESATGKHRTPQQNQILDIFKKTEIVIFDKLVRYMLILKLPSKLIQSL